MPSKDKRCNLTLDDDILRALDTYMRHRGYRCRATAVYLILYWFLLDEGYLSPPAGGE